MSLAVGAFVRQLGFFWLSSLVLATAGYYLLRAVLPGHRVFGSWYRVFDYHDQHPLPYIALCCFFFGLLAARYAPAIARQPLGWRLRATALLVAGTVLLSSPVGGALWHLHDMQAGYFPANWPVVLLGGAREGLLLGWLIVLLSAPYNVLGTVVAYYLLRKGAAVAGS
jgi:hypothetical protein